MSDFNGFFPKPGKRYSYARVVEVQPAETGGGRQATANTWNPRKLNRVDDDPDGIIINFIPGVEGGADAQVMVGPGVYYLRATATQYRPGEAWLRFRIYKGGVGQGGENYTVAGRGVNNGGEPSWVGEVETYRDLTNFLPDDQLNIRVEAWCSNRLSGEGAGRWSGIGGYEELYATLEIFKEKG